MLDLVDHRQEGVVEGVVVKEEEGVGVVGLLSKEEEGGVVNLHF